MAGTMGSWKTRDVVFQVELTPHTSSTTVEQEEEDGRTAIINYLKEGKLHDNPREARPLLRCVSYPVADYVLREVHEGCCGNHLGAYALARKVEAEPLARITENDVLKFLWKNIVCRYRVPRRLISDNGRQFQGAAKIQAWCKEMKIQQVFTSIAYPQSNGQVEVTNRTLVHGLKV
ncbi:uncharacterized protein [Primulina eburnea]|uniref:uncharacterized protein n=1 Tax=Primulina eburnea TaxID=1245227 RepID=UPI003C6C1591